MALSDEQLTTLSADLKRPARRSEVALPGSPETVGQLLTAGADGAVAKAYNIIRAGVSVRVPLTREDVVAEFGDAVANGNAVGRGGDIALLLEDVAGNLAGLKVILPNLGNDINRTKASWAHKLFGSDAVSVSHRDVAKAKAKAIGGRR